VLNNSIWNIIFFAVRDEINLTACQNNCNYKRINKKMGADISGESNRERSITNTFFFGLYTLFTFDEKVG
jgi:hypothetical protein